MDALEDEKPSPGLSSELARGAEWGDVSGTCRVLVWGGLCRDIVELGRLEGMTGLTLTVGDRQLAARIAESAAHHGLTVDEYAEGVLAAAQEHDAADRGQRATALARVAYRKWNVAGRPEEDTMSTADVFEL
ncbi:hypothetical protein ACN20G_26430 (plasmid) [Streptomyces sp. BI20]|uniref:hypothetical protein n=1 Tax=Streptomyces sp. BI20 TaxID=3403460 RepID=UPI003C74CF18